MAFLHHRMLRLSAGPPRVSHASTGYDLAMRHASNRERIARAAAEAAAAAAEKTEAAAAGKTEKRSAKKRSASRPKRAAAPVRMKVVWEVCTGTGRVVKTFAYADKEAAEAARLALIDAKGETHLLRDTKVPME